MLGLVEREGGLDLSVVKNVQTETVQKKTKRKTIHKRQKMEPTQSIIEILQSSEEPMEAKAVWQNSKHKDHIESFYAELKSVEDQVIEIRDDQRSLLHLKK